MTAALNGARRISIYSDDVPRRIISVLSVADISMRWLMRTRIVTMAKTPTMLAQAMATSGTRS